MNQLSHSPPLKVQSMSETLLLDVYDVIMPQQQQLKRALTLQSKSSGQMYRMRHSRRVLRCEFRG